MADAVVIVAPSLLLNARELLQTNDDESNGLMLDEASLFVGSVAVIASAALNSMQLRWNLFIFHHR